MADILHRIGIKSSSIDDVYQALITERGLAEVLWSSSYFYIATYSIFKPLFKS